MLIMSCCNMYCFLFSFYLFIFSLATSEFNLSLIFMPFYGKLNFLHIHCALLSSAFSVVLRVLMLIYIISIHSFLLLRSYWYNIFPFSVFSPELWVSVLFNMIGLSKLTINIIATCWIISVYLMSVFRNVDHVTAAYYYLYLTFLRDCILLWSCSCVAVVIGYL